MTALLFRDDPYLRNCETAVTAINERGGVLTAATIFYANAGGQPGDKGALQWPGGQCRIATTVYDENRNPVHVPAEGEALPPKGTRIAMSIDWAHRYRIMRCHTMMHLLCAAVPYPVTGSSITADGGRIDFDIPEGQLPDRTALADRINDWIRLSHPVSDRWISEDELDANPQLVRTLFARPPRGTGQIRLVLIGEDGAVDVQPCGGTHVRNTSEIGEIAVEKIENKGKINRRIRLVLVNK